MLACGVGVSVPHRGNAWQAGCGGVEISAFFRLMHYPLTGGFFPFCMRFAGVLCR